MFSIPSYGRILVIIEAVNKLNEMLKKTHIRRWGDSMKGALSRLFHISILCFFRGICTDHKAFWFLKIYLDSSWDIFVLQIRHILQLIFDWKGTIVYLKVDPAT